MALSVVRTASTDNFDTTPDTTTLSFDATGCDKLIAVYAIRDITDTDRPISGVTRDGQSFTQVRVEDNSGNESVEVWYLDSPNTGTANIVATLGGDIGFMGHAAIGLSGAETGAPLQNGSIGTSTSRSVAVTMTDDGVVIGVLVRQGTDTVNDDSGQTSFMTLTSTHNRHAAYKTTTGSGSKAIGWNWTSSLKSAAITVGVEQAAGSDTQLVVGDVAHSHAADTPTLSTDIVLVVAGDSLAHAADSPTLTYAAELTVAGDSLAHAADTPTLVTASVLAVADVAHSHTADQPTLDLSTLLTVADVAHSHTADTPTLVTASVLAVADVSHAHAADTPTLVTASVLVVAGDTLAHTADQPTVVATAVAYLQITITPLYRRWQIAALERRWSTGTLTRAP